jgi:hypothetical protein
MAELSGFGELGLWEGPSQSAAWLPSCRINVGPTACKRLHFWCPIIVNDANGRVTPREKLDLVLAMNIGETKGKRNGCRDEPNSGVATDGASLHAAFGSGSICRVNAGWC